MATFTCKSATDAEVSLHRQIAELAALEPGIIDALHLVVKRILEAASDRVYNEQWEGLAVALEQKGPQGITDADLPDELRAKPKATKKGKR